MNPAGWWRKVRRRRGGVYAWRTDRHGVPWLREWGYAGESVSFAGRRLDHLGRGRYGQPAKDWSDLNPKQYRVIPLPWWLCWKWVLRPLETLVILLLRPRYNVAKNRWNRRRIPPYLARRQRQQRDAARRAGDGGGRQNDGRRRPARTGRR